MPTTSCNSGASSSNSGGGAPHAALDAVRSIGQNYANQIDCNNYSCQPSTHPLSAAMTRDELISKQADWKRYRSRIIYIYIGGFGIFIVWSFLFSGTKDLNGTSPIFKGILFLYSTGGAILLLWLNVRRMKQLGAACPKCGRPFFVSAIGTQSVFATGNCGRCGEKIISE
jgi:hypothetical protein